MDFMNRGTRPAQNETMSAGQDPRHPQKINKPRGRIGGGAGKAGLIALLIVTAVLVVAAAYLLVSAKHGNREAQAVNKDKFQAVFLNGGQVYFGKVEDLNSKFLRLNNIYYLRVNQQVQPGQENSVNDVSLVKLGCELHGPTDEMLINREQIIFWENLKTEGQVAKAIEEYVKTNPGEQKCEQASQQNSSSSNNSTPANNSTPPATRGATEDSPPASTTPATP